MLSKKTKDSLILLLNEKLLLFSMKLCIKGYEHNKQFIDAVEDIKSIIKEVEDN